MIAQVLAPLLTALAVRLPCFVDTALKGSLVLALCAIAVRGLRRTSAANRYAIWFAGIVGHLMLPLLTWYAPPLYWPFLPAPPWLAASAAFDRAMSGIPPDRAARVLVACAVVWLIGVLFRLGRLATSRLMLSRFAQLPAAGARASLQTAFDLLRERLSVRRPVSLRIGTTATTPMTWGLVRPTIVLPRGAESWSADLLTVVLAHELEHVRRRDTIAQLVAQVTLALFWFDPLVWLAAGRMRLEREFACDDAVLATGVAPWTYAEHLLTIARRLRDAGDPPTPHTFAAITGEGPLEIEMRVRALLDSSTQRQRHSRGWLIAVLALTLMEVPLGALRPFRSPTTSVVTAPR